MQTERFIRFLYNHFFSFKLNRSFQYCFIKKGQLTRDGRRDQVIVEHIVVLICLPTIELQLFRI